MPCHLLMQYLYAVLVFFLIYFYIFCRLIYVESNDRDRFLAVHCCDTNVCNGGQRPAAPSVAVAALLLLLFATSFRYFFRYWSCSSVFVFGFLFSWPPFTHSLSFSLYIVLYSLLFPALFLLIYPFPFHIYTFVHTRTLISSIYIADIYLINIYIYVIYFPDLFSFVCLSLLVSYSHLFH